MLSYLFFLLTTISFGIWTVRNIFFWVMLWQLKEYRFDRLFAHLKETAQGRKILFSFVLWIKIALIFLYILVTFNYHLNTVYDFGIGIIFIYQGIVALAELFKYRPTRTVKALGLIAAILFVTSIFVLFPLTNDKFLWLLIIDRLVPIIIFILVVLFSFPTDILQEIKMNKARLKIQKNKRLLVIAVSGSYGKSSTKEYVAQILSKQFKVVKTPFSNNTPIGITNTILDLIEKDTEIFVVEMGAYKQGEIEELCQIVKPRISITTSVSDQHLSLFGSLEKAIATEKELIQALPRNGLALFNGNNINSYVLYQQADKKKILYNSLPSSKKKADIKAQNIQVNKALITFDVVLKHKVTQFKTRLLGKHNVENILPAIFIARYLKIEYAVIQDAVFKLMPPAKTMSKRILSSGATAVDDTFNASPESVYAAINYLKLYNKKRVFIFTPLIELGKSAKIHHYQIGLELGKYCTHIFLTNNNFYQDIERGVLVANRDCVLKVAKKIEIAKELVHFAAGDVLIFEGKEAGVVLKQLED